VPAIALAFKVPRVQVQAGNILALMDEIRFLAEAAPHIAVVLSNFSEGGRERRLIKRIFLVISA